MRRRHILIIADDVLVNARTYRPLRPSGSDTSISFKGTLAKGNHLFDSSDAIDLSIPESSTYDFVIKAPENVVVNEFYPAEELALPTTSKTKRGKSR